MVDPIEYNLYENELQNAINESQELDPSITEKRQIKRYTNVLAMLTLEVHKYASQPLTSRTYARYTLAKKARLNMCDIINTFPKADQMEIYLGVYKVIPSPIRP